MTRRFRFPAVSWCLKHFAPLCALALLGAACIPSPPPPARPCIERQSVDGAIDCAFARFGLAVQDQAHRVAWCESRKNPNAENGQYKGLFQLGSYHYWRFGGYPWQWPGVNADAAAGLYQDTVADGRYGWGPWQCKP